MNIIQIQDALKDFSEEQLIREMQQPSGNAPQYLVLTEIERRQKVKKDMQSQQGSEPSVAEEAVSRRMPAQNSAIAQSMVQPSPASQPPQMKAGGITALKMRDGGVVKASNGFFADVTNNPGNIRTGAGFIGESGSEKGFATFSDPIYGMRALARLPSTYANEYGINTVEGFVSRYAPRSENKESFDNYINFLSRQLGVRPDQEVDFADPQVRQAMLPAIMDFEQGAGYSDRYDPSMFSAAVAAADLEDPEDIMTAFSSARSPDETKQAPFIPGISAAQASTPTPSALTLPGADKEKATPEERWEFLSRRPPGGLSVEERAELFDLTKQFGRYQPPAKTEGLGSPELNEFLQEYVLDPFQTYIGDPIAEFTQENIVAPVQSAIEDPERAGAYLVSTPEELEQFDEDRAKRLQEEAIARAEESGDATRRGSPADEVLPAEDPAVAAEVAAETRPAPDQTETTGMPTVNELLMDLRDRQQAQIEAAREDEEFNRYLAIAQMGAKLAEGKGPFVGAIGEAIGEGLPTLAAARQGVREAEKEALQTDIDIAQTLADAQSKGGLSEYQANTLILSVDGAINRARDDIQKIMQDTAYLTADAEGKARILKPYEDQIASLELQKQAILLQSANLPASFLGVSGATTSAPPVMSRESFRAEAGLD